MARIENHDFIEDTHVYHEIDTSGYGETPQVYNEISGDDGLLNPQIEEGYEQLRDMARKRRLKPIYDFTTKNKSFIDLYNDLKTLGITNNKFFLRLYQKELQGFDVYSPIVPIDMQLKIILECMINPWYFLREVCRIPEDGSPIEPGGGTQYRIDRNNLATWYLFLNHIDHYASKPRQTGKTQDAIAKFNYAYHFGTLASTITFGNKDATAARENLFRLKSQRDLLPKWMQMRTIIDDATGKIERETDNVTTMKNPITKNTIVTLPKATSKESATKIGRGKTTALQYWDEFDFTPWQTEIIDASVFAYKTAADNAIKNSAMACRIFTSTPGDLDTRDGDEATKFVNGMLPWKDKYLDMPILEFKKKLYTPGYNKIVFVEHTWKQLKKSVAWYEDQCANARYQSEKILREIELKRMRGSDKSPFDKDDLLYLSRHIKEPIMEEDLSKNLCPIIFYEKLQSSYPYIIAVDPSEGLGEDNNAMTIINPYTLRPAAEFKSPYISPPDFFRMICKFMDTYCPHAMIVIENNRGRELINRFLESKYKYRLWYDVDKLTQPITENTNEYGAVKQAANIRKAYGFNTGHSSRNRLFVILEELVVNDKDKLIGKYLVDDIMSLERYPNGKIAAAAKHHDDNVISYLIGMCVYYNATNLEEFGIIRGMRAPAAPIDKNDPEYQRSVIMGILNQLPQEAQSVLNKFFGMTKERNPVDDANNYNQHLVDIETRRTMEMNDDSDIELKDNVFADENVSRAFDQQIFETNFINSPSIQYNNPYDEEENRKQFDVDDWV